MKRIIVSLMLVVGLGLSIQATAQQTQTQTQTRVRYYYYPSSNVYYNPTENEYWYYDDASSQWQYVQNLPTTIKMTKTPRYTVYYNGEDVWKDNTMHQRKYKIKKNGVVKAKH
jgi:hypothetical protein